jgi:molybdopterin molybdotransferase
VPWEQTDLGSVAVNIYEPIACGSNVRAPDEEIAVRQLLVGEGETIGPANLSAMVAAGIRQLATIPAPRVAILTTGNEIVNDSDTVPPGAVLDSNGPLLEAFVNYVGAEVVAYQTVGDDPDATFASIERIAPHCDLIVTTGGVSVGEHDWLRSTIEKNGNIGFWRVAMRPGKPLLFGEIAGKPILALPGNPTSALVGSYLFLGPLIAALSGHQQTELSTVEITSAVAGSPGRVKIVAGHLTGRRFAPINAKHPGLGNMARTDGLAVIEEHGAEPGTEAAFIPLTG